MIDHSGSYKTYFKVHCSIPAPGRGFPNVRLDHLSLCLSLPAEAKLKKKQKVISHFHYLLSPYTSRFYTVLAKQLLFPHPCVFLGPCSRTWELLVRTDPAPSLQNTPRCSHGAAPTLLPSKLCASAPSQSQIWGLRKVSSAASLLHILSENLFLRFSTLIPIGINHK